MRLTLIAAAAAALTTAQVQAAEVKPAIVYDLGGKFDKSFNEAAFNGAERYESDTGTAYRDFEIQSDSQREQALRNFARRGFDPIIGVGFSQAQAMEQVAEEYPDTHFAIIDTVVDAPNIRSVVFDEEDGSYLVGVLAAMASESGKIGFVGGMDIPLVRKFACGYVQGAKAIDPDIQVIENMTGTTGAAWNDPVRGGELAKSQFDQGVDVVYHAAGGTGVGVLQAAADAGKLGIGVDSNQNMTHPGSVLTSMVKRVDNAVYETIEDVANDEWTAGTQRLGLKDDGVAWALDENNRDLISDEMEARVGEAREKIISGDVEVHDYMSDNSCPAQS